MDTTSETVKVVWAAGEVECAREAAVDMVGKLMAEHKLPHDAFRFVDVPAALPRNSNFSGELVRDEAGAARVAGQYASLRAAGVTGIKDGKTPAGYAPGTRMADVGYANQARRAREHEAKAPAKDVAAALAGVVRAEKRRDVATTAGDVAGSLYHDADGRLTFSGYRLGEQAIRGLCGRAESPALRYILGVRDRIAATRANPDYSKPEGAGLRAHARADRDRILETLVFELRQNPGAKVKLRVREANGDVFAALSHEYTPADADAMLDEILDQLPAGTRASYAYDPTTTDWEFRASVFTPTPVMEQVVGEAFEGYASFRGRDNGTRHLGAGGGVTILNCLNAGVYVAEGTESRRIHRRNVMVDVGAMIEAATGSIEALLSAWGVAREQEVDVPSGLTIEDAVPGFWRYLLRDQRSELAGVLAGRSEAHVEALSKAYWSERRDGVSDRVVRADLYQGWTRHIQSLPTAERRDAEQAAGAWLVAGRRVGCDVKA